jgi:CheY-like chemotaxis protein
LEEEKYIIKTAMPKILVIDDSVSIRKVAELHLTEAGLEVCLATSGEEALAFLEKERPDLVVSDITMSGKTGFEVCAFVRSQPALAGTPVLLISGVVNDEVTKQASSCGANGVLKKPFQGTSLKDRVLELLSKQTPPNQAAAPQTASGGAGAEDPRLTAKLKELEDGLEGERGKVARLAERLDGLEKNLAEERDKSAQLTAERDKMKIHIEELEATVLVERDAAAQLISRMDAKGKPPQP